MSGHRVRWHGLLGERRWWQRRCTRRTTLDTYTIVQCDLRLNHPDPLHAIYRGFDALTWR